MEENVQTQISALNAKLDTIMEYLAEQKQRNQIIDDLVQDVSIVGTDAFKTAVTEFEDQGINIDGEEVRLMIFKFLKSIDKLNMLFDMLNSAGDFAKDALPVVNEIIKDTTYKLAEMESKGVFISLGNIAKNLSDPSFLKGIENMTQAISTVKMDEKLDNKSLWGIFRELKSKEVRQSLSYMLRVVKNLHQLNK